MLFALLQCVPWGILLKLVNKISFQGFCVSFVVELDAYSISFIFCCCLETLGGITAQTISTSMKAFILSSVALLTFPTTNGAFVPFLDGGKGMPKLYDGWFNDQIAKQAATAMSKAIAAGNVSKSNQYKRHER